MDTVAPVSGQQSADATYDDANRPLEVMVSIIAGDMVTLCYDFPIPD